MPLARWMARLHDMRWRAFWAGLRHDIAVRLGRTAGPDSDGRIPAWDPTLPKGVVSYGPGSRRGRRGRRR